MRNKMLKPPFKLGFFKFPFLSKDKYDQLVGLAAPHFKRSFYFIFNSFNVSITQLSRKEIRCIADNCPILTYRLETELHFIAGLTSLPKLTKNITIAPPLSEIQCFLLTAPDKEERTEFHDIISIFSETSVWMFLSAFLVMWSLMVLISYINPIRIADALWLTTKILVRNYSKTSKIVSQKSLINMILFTGVLHLFFTSSVQTNMVKNKDFIRVETLEELAERSGSLAFGGIDCQFLVASIRDDDLKRKLLSKANGVYDNEHIFEVMDNVNRTKSDGCLIDKKDVFAMLFHISCSSVGNQIVSRKDTYTSKKPALTAIGLNFISTNLPPKSRKLFRFGAYAGFEMSLIHEIASPRLARGLVGETKQSCAEEPLIVEQALFSPLKYNFFTSVFILYSLVTILSIVVLIIGRR